MARLDEWCSTGQIRYSDAGLHYTAEVFPSTAPAEGRRRDPQRVLPRCSATSMGMINGYFGRAAGRHGFAEHKVDQACAGYEGRQARACRGSVRFAPTTA
jgi:hypothetical protein